MKPDQKINSLIKYIDDMRHRLNNIPAKHKANPQPYLDWVNLEIKRHSKRLEELSLSTVKGK